VINFDELTYTTDDEVAFLFDLANRGKWGVLQGLKRAYRTRCWTGDGMDVNPFSVMAALDMALANRIGV
jgi:hypothetical protein